MRINLNDKVKVYLTKLGVDIYQKSIHRGSIHMHVDDDGAATLQWWELMVLYGNYIGFGKPMPFYMDVEYEPQVKETEKLCAELEQVTRERDAAIEDMRGRCYVCAHAKQHDLFPNFTTCEHMTNCIAFLGNGKKWCEHWEWRGVPQGVEQRGQH